MQSAAEDEGNVISFFRYLVKVLEKLQVKVTPGPFLWA